MATGLERLVRAYLDHLGVERGASPHTLAGYRRDLNRYLNHLASRGITEPGAVTEAEITGFGADLGQGERPLAPSSVARALVAVRGLHRFAAAEGLGENPAAAISPPKQARRLPKALDQASVQRLLEAPDPSTPTGLRDAALLELLYGTGARISEVLDLDVDDLTPALADPDLGLRLFGKGRKERLVPLGSFARKAVEAWLVRGRPSWAAKATRATPALLLNSLGRRLSRQSAWAIIRQHAEAAGITAEVGPHTLRHSYATHLLDGGADVRVVQELLGHASVTTTQLYTLVTVEHLREVFLSSHPRAL
ncbi:MAG: site-specific tyrosine recombinase XerD [Propionicimonas sp.]